MQRHTKIYFDYFNYGIDDVIPCEVCGCKAVDIHHILRRGMGGSKEKDHIDNLMAVCRECHIQYGDKKQYIDFLKEKHNVKLHYKNSKRSIIK
jgi:hypothetical protein